jgi:hypothetical protein
MSNLILATHQDVISWNWSGEELLTRLIELDTKHIEGMDETDEGSVPQWAPVFMQHPHTWSLLVDQALLPSLDAVVGYWSFCSLQPEPYAQAIAGCLNDSEITPASQRSINGPGEYDIYIVMFVIAHTYRRIGSAMLLRGFFENLLSLARKGIFVRRLSANAFTPAGVRMAPIFGVEPVCPHVKRGHIYARTITPDIEQPFPAVFAELNRLYHARHSDPGSPGIDRGFSPCELAGEPLASPTCGSAVL